MVPAIKIGVAGFMYVGCNKNVEGHCLKYLHTILHGSIQKCAVLIDSMFCVF